MVRLMKKLFFLLLMFFTPCLQAAMVTKDLATFGSQVRIFMEYDDVTLLLSTTAIHCVNNSNFNAAFKFTTLGISINGENVFPAHTTGAGIFNGSVGQIQITNLSKNDFDKLQGYFVWPR